MQEPKPVYSAIYLSGDLGTRFRVTTGHEDLESAETAVKRWCEGQEERLRTGEVVVCCGVSPELREVSRLVSGEWRRRVDVESSAPVRLSGVPAVRLEI